jgi:cysteine-rich repeat protein
MDRRSGWKVLVLVASVSTLVACGGGTTDGDSGVAEDSGSAMVVVTAPRCGDGRRQRDTEVCDDGNTVDGDGCSADCQSDESCGNGITDTAAGELCDDGNTDDGDTCRGDCRSDYACGNGVVDSVAGGAREDEVCDDGNTINGDGCSADCQSDESCGNGTIDLGAGEACDDGNTDDGDECSADCRTSLLCGNGTLDAPEECDDGNGDEGDGCDASCRVERCGNGRVDAGEACDDGNDEPNDGCRADCAFTCSDDAACGNGDLCDGEERCEAPGGMDSRCEAPSAPADDGTACGDGLICRMGGCVTSACGDGVTVAGEQCDDGNTADGDGCDNDCTFTCAGDADCTDGNACNGVETCASPGTTASACVPGTPPSEGASCGAGRICRGGTCSTAGCGDGFVSPGEQCDDGNMTDGDGCDGDCTWTCASAADCADANVCNGAETCASPGTLASRCNAGTPPTNGTACGTGLICVTGSCVSARCGDGIVSTGEQCDDGNTTNGDGCNNDCRFTCANDAACSDGNACNGAETCASPGTTASRCTAGTAPPTGTACDRDMMPATRDICRAGTCVASRCGDGFTDAGATPPEQCDDGNTAAGDGCSPTCQTEMATPPTAFRLNTMRLISPRIVADIPLGGCQDITDNPARVFGLPVADSINTQLANALNPTTVTNGTWSLHIVDVFRPLDRTAPTTPMDLHLNAACMEPLPGTCGPDAMPDVTPSTANNRTAGTCFTPTAADVNGRRGTATVTYSPTANTVSAPCFVSDEQLLTVTLSGIAIPLQRARVSATYSGTPTNALASGVVVGFLSSQAAADIRLPATLPSPLGGAPLYSVLQANDRTVRNTAGMTIADSCNLGGGTHEDDTDVLPDGTRGFWFFLNFTGARITWTGP